MEKTVLKPAGIHKPYSNYSHGIVVEGAKRIVFCAGQVAGDSEGNLVGEGDFEAQADQVMANLKAVLTEAGASFGDVVKVTLYVVKQEDTTIPSLRRPFPSLRRRCSQASVFNPSPFLRVAPKASSLLWHLSRWCCRAGTGPTSR